MFTSLQEMLVSALGPLGPLIAVGFLGLVLILIALPTMMKKQRDRFSELKIEARSGKADDRALRRGTGGTAEKLEKFAHFLEPQKAEEMSAIRLKLLRAGYPDKSAVHMFHAAKLVLGIGLLALGLIYAMLKSANEEVSTQSMILYTLMPGALGYYLPQYWVNKRMTKRQTEITQGFPDALDLMLVCVEAGQSLDQAIIRVGKESRAGYPALADEFDMVSHEVKAGKERVTVLKDMSERVGIPDVASFVTTLVQSATFGTSIAEALRVYSADMRDKRVMRAEEKANMLPTKLTLGTMMFTVPPLMIILIGPSVYGIATMLGQMNTN
ncbi:type II secretion system F family protein [Rhodobacter sp. SGA-6-6]|uniref:type II secretion system F family protein n=1 Tax=Rhodobacter sp. SGA-6-6 TaxID=2710882 RepID=UPI0013EC7B65|nr:type II secretion system F family protein [Rhodobacter sp. SGA-6-6]NGM45316.1 type II secretion system F family protein [Rhodobacter sp. SGA-6-6]